MSTISAIRLIVALGIVNLVTGLLVFFSCRCLPGFKIAQRHTQFYRGHCYYWRAFWASVVTHAVLVIVFLGFPRF